MHIAMHIMEDFLSPVHAAVWTVAFAPFVVAGVRSLTRILKENPQAKLLLATSGAFAFVLSALKIPSVTGSCSHPTGTGLGAVLFVPSVMAVLPLLLPVAKHRDEPFTGADGQAEAGIVAAYPSYEPWFEPFWEPPSGEIESLLFALKAALSAGLLGYFSGCGEASPRAALLRLLQENMDRAAHHDKPEAL